MVPLLAFLLATVAVQNAAAAVYVDVTCTAQICEEQLVSAPCPSLSDACLAGYQLPYAGVCNCCPYCFEYIGEGEVCSVGTPAQPLPSAMCGPGLVCSASNSSGGDAVCTWMTTACALAAQDSGGVAAWPAQCDEDGYFEGAQCVPNGLCYCVEKYSGTRIFGDAVFESLSQQQAMTCGCSRAAWTASQLVDTSLGVARCLPDGSFDTLQCVAGQCACVDQDTGVIDATAGSVSVNDLDADALPCFDSSRHTVASWETQCERERRLALQAATELEAQGVLPLGVGVRPPTCDPDGSYHRLQLRPPRKECVDARGNLIENFAVDMTSDLAANMDCKCARTRLLLQQAGSLELPACCPGGSYRPWQCRRGRCYCVSSDGQQVGADVQLDSLPELSCYTANSDPCAPADDQQEVQTTTEEITTIVSSTQEATTNEATTTQDA